MSASVTMMFQCRLIFWELLLQVDTCLWSLMIFKTHRNTMLSATIFSNVFMTNCHSAPSKGLELHVLWLLFLLGWTGQASRICYKCPGMFVTQVIIWRKSVCTYFATFLLGLETLPPEAPGEGTSTTWAPETRTQVRALPCVHFPVSQGKQNHLRHPCSPRHSIPSNINDFLL